MVRTIFEAEAETLIPPLVFASVMMLKPAFHRWRFKIVRTVVINKGAKIRQVVGSRINILKINSSVYGQCWLNRAYSISNFGVA